MTDETPTNSRPESKDGPSGLDVNVEPPTPPEEWDKANEVLNPRDSKSGPATPTGTRDGSDSPLGFVDGVDGGLGF